MGIDFLNRLLPTALHRIIFSFVLMLGVVGAASIWPKPAVVIFMAIMAASLAGNIRFLWLRHRKRWWYVVIRSIRSVRKIFHASPMLKVVYLISFLTAILILSYSILHGNATALSFAVFGALIAAIGGVDFVRVLIALTRYVWARTLGRVALIAISLSSVWVAGVLAEHTVGTLTAMNPKSFDATVNAVTGLFTPFVYIGIGSLVVFLLSAIFFLILLITTLTYQSISPLTMLIPRQRVTRKTSLAYRLIHGRRRPIGIFSSFFDWDSIVLLLRPLAMASVSCVVLLGITTQLDMMEGFLQKKFLAKLIVEADFHRNHRCLNLASDARVHYLDEDNVLVAVDSSSNQSFTLAKCRMY